MHSIAPTALRDRLSSAGRACLAALCLARAAGAVSGQDAPGAPRTARVSSGPVTVTITADPPRVHLDRDILLTVAVEAPEAVVPRAPVLEGRLAGLALSGSFEREPALEGGRRRHEYCYRLTPGIAEEYRLAPFAVHWAEPGRAGAPGAWLATPAMRFDVEPVTDSEPGADLRPPREPVWIHPSPRAASIAVGLALLAALAAWALARLARRLIRAVRRRLLSPRDRALLELSDLVARGLIGRGEFKAFFLELTGIVRRYIERAHRIRAPEQTTEEFLNAAARDPRFRPDVLATLRRFLETADLVKFAAYRPDPGAADRAHATAVEYIRTDERLSAPADRELA